MEEQLKEHRDQISQTTMPLERDLFSEAALEKLIATLKSEIDRRVGSETRWHLSIRTMGTIPFPERSELIVKIEHPDVAVAWRASLEFLDLYAKALKQRNPSLSAPASNAFRMEYIPAVK
jgi:hypothetical protein